MQSRKRPFPARKPARTAVARPRSTLRVMRAERLAASKSFALRIGTGTGVVVNDDHLGSDAGGGCGLEDAAHERFQILDLPMGRDNLREIDGLGNHDLPYTTSSG
jgi:hypothetical protein